MLSMALFVLLGLLAGSLSGLIGIGGGVILVPALVFGFGFTQHLAQGTTLALLVPPIGLLAAWSYYKRGHVDLRIAALVCVGFFIGGFFGAKLAVLLSNILLERIFGACLLVIGLRMLFAKPEEHLQAQEQVHLAEPATLGLGRMLLFVLLGMTVGTFSGLLGIGGGALMVPALVFLFGMNQHQAQGTTLALMVPPVGVLGAWEYFATGDVDVTAGLLICAGFVFGALVGAGLAGGLSSRVLSRTFGVAMLLIAIKMLMAF